MDISGRGASPHCDLITSRIDRRREAVPLVCKAWRAASGADSPIWDVCELTHPAAELKRPRVGVTLRWQAVVRRALT